MFPKGKDPTNLEICILYIKMATPNIVTSMLVYAPILVNFLYAGHLENLEELAAVGIATATLFMFLLPLMMGTTQVMETQHPDAYES